ncbi:MAG: mechanosensitive ion channel family protein, partial [Spirochaetia bacterium]|nr:mechanosensitive ion channel family protein [Spirochaetia bacterium]
MKIFRNYLILFFILFFISISGIFAEDPIIPEPVSDSIQKFYLPNIPVWLTDTYLSLKTWQWVGLFIAVILGMILRALSGFVAALGIKLFTKTGKAFNTRFIHNIKKPIGLLILSWFWMASIHILLIKGSAYTVLKTSLQILYSIGFIWFFYRFSDLMIEYLRILTNKTESTLDNQLVPLLNKTIKVSIIIFGSLITFQNLGINVMSLLAGLGIGGLAFALAAKDTVANFFGSLMIIFDQPFQVGDWIIVNDKEGTVEEIGFRSTRIRTFYNSL